jgi:hypothetical protein
VQRIINYSRSKAGRNFAVTKINELIGRLMNSLPRHGLQTNKTLLSFPQNFPLNRAMYVDFSHDNLMVAVFTAMGLFKQTNGPLDTTKITEDRT